MQQLKYSVVQVIDQLNIGGAERILVTLANLLYQHGHTTAVVTTVAPGPLANDLHHGISLINLHRQWKWNPITMYRLIKSVRHFDIIHVHSSPNLRYVFLAGYLFRLRKRIFYQEHYGNAVTIIPNTLQRYIYRQTVFIAVSGKLAAWAKRNIGMSGKRVFVLPNTVIKTGNLTTFQKEKDLRICMVGNILPNKNMLFALALLHALQQQHHPATLTIIGAIADEDYYDKLLQYIDEKNLRKTVFFITDCPYVQNILHRFTLGIHTSLSESGPLVLIEYLAQGLPFITYNTGEAASQLQHYLPYFIMQDFHISKWIQAIDKIISLPGEKLSAELQNLYSEHFSPEDYYNKCITIYKAGLAATP